MGQIITQATVVEQEEPTPGRISSQIALFNEDGTPFTGGGGGGTTGYTGSQVLGSGAFYFEDGLLKSVNPL